MHKFTYENTYPDQLPVTVEFTIPSDASLDDMCQEFTNYLRAIGFHIPEGKLLDFVPEDGYSSKGWDSFEPDVTEDFEPKDEPFKPFAYSINSATPQEWNNAYQNVTVKYKEHD
jgi:hypothetical protein